VSVATARTDLPPLIARYVERNVPSGDTASRVRFGQVGEMQLKPGRWTQFEAEQEFSVQRVEFSWRARFPLAPLVALHVRDWYHAGEGALEVRLWHLPIKRLRGDAVAKGEAIRYLAELPWAPQAVVLNRELEWREVDDWTTEVGTRVAGERVAVLLHFDAAGDIVAASAQDRPRAVGKDSVATPFAGEFGDYQVFEGVRLPTTAAVRWELEEGPFVYFRGRIMSFATA